jgi:hypothetical protein
MSQEIRIQATLQVTNPPVQYYSQPGVSIANQVGVGGPAPGTVLAGVGGININFGPLTTPACCRIQNYDTVNFITYGVFDAESNEFYPLGEALPGESYVIRLSRHMKTVYPPTGTGSPGAPLSFHIRADRAPCLVQVDAFQA